MERPWIKNYDAHVSPSINIPEIAMTALLDEAVRDCPDQPFIVYYGRVIKYRQFDKLVTQFANALYQLGIRRGSLVSLVLPNVPQYLIAHWAVWRLGGIIVPINPLYTKRELERQLMECQSETVIVLDAIYPRIKALKNNDLIRSIIVCSIKDFLPAMLRAFYPFRGRKDRPQIDFKSEPRIKLFTDLMHQTFPPAPQIHLGPNDTAILLYTGGTTGVPMAAELTHRALVANVHQARHWLWHMQEQREVIIAVLPFFHSYGMTCVHHITVLIKSCMILMPKFDTENLMRIIQKYKVSLFPGVPTMYAAINNHPAAKKFRLTSITACISGADTLPVGVQRQFEALTGGKLVEGYGLTECSPVTHVNPIRGKRKVGTIGLPLPNTDAIILDPQTHQPLPSGKVGELAIRGPQVMKCYWQRPAETRSVFTVDGWLLTGDLARMDEDGFFFIVDRKKDLIITGGFNVYPSEIEEVLLEHARVKEAAVVGIPDDFLGEKIKAFIVLKDKIPLAPDEFIKFCRGKLAKYKIPFEFEFRNDLPRSFLGKIMRRELANQERARTEAPALL